MKSAITVGDVMLLAASLQAAHWIVQPTTEFDPDLNLQKRESHFGLPFVAKPRPRIMIVPTFTADVDASGRQVFVHAALRIDTKGNVTDVALIQVECLEKSRARVEEHARTSLLKFKFFPVVRDGVPVECETDYVVVLVGRQ